MKTERFNNYEASYGSFFRLIVMEFPRRARIELLFVSVAILAQTIHLTNHLKDWQEAQTMVLLGLVSLVYFLRRIVTDLMIDASERVYQIPASPGRRIDFNAIRKKVFFERANLEQYNTEELLSDADHAEKNAPRSERKVFMSVAGIYGSIFSILGFFNQYLLGKEDWDTKLLGLKLSLLPILMLTMIFGVVVPSILDYRRDRKNRFLNIAKWLAEWARRKRKKD